MKIEAKKSKLNLTGNQAARPGTGPAREPRPETEKPFIAEPQPKPPKKGIPKIKLPRISLPAIKLPKIKLPKLKRPDFKAPKPVLPKAKGSRKKYVIVLLAAIPALAA